MSGPLSDGSAARLRMLQTSLDRMNDLIDVALQQRRTALLPDVLRRFEEAADHVAALRKSVGA